MPSMGLVVDGDFDEKALTVLLRRCRRGLRVLPRQPGRSITKAVNILPELDRRKLDGALWVTDAEGDDPVDLRKRMREAVARAGLKLCVECVVAVKMLEAWLLADDQALKQIAGSAQVYRTPENISDPKKELRRLLARANIVYTPLIQAFTKL